MIDFAIQLAILVGLFFVLEFITKKIFIKTIRWIIKKSKNKWDDILVENGVFDRARHIIPLLIILFLIPYYFEILKQTPVYNIINALIIINIMIVINRILDTILDIYNELSNVKKRPIKAYIQLIKIFVYVVFGISAVFVLFGKSPLGILSGIGAFTAVLMFVFKDTILSLLATLQIIENDLIKEGDWIEVPQFKADGDVIEIALHVVKVQNFDKTITTIPTYKLIESSFKNWRGMQQSGARRIKRSIHIDLNSMFFCDEKFFEKVKDIEYVKEYINEIKDNNKKITNMEVFKKYVENYLKQHPKIINDYHPDKKFSDKKFTFLLRELEPTENGLPFQLYVFATDNTWVNYENIQSEIFNHIIVATKLFDLRLFQNISGQDFRLNSNII
jgi:miniconductance mechanosensitive channel